jgi:hypothetical protein
MLASQHSSPSARIPFKPDAAANLRLLERKLLAKYQGLGKAM